MFQRSVLDGLVADRLAIRWFAADRPAVDRLAVAQAPSVVGGRSPEVVRPAVALAARALVLVSAQMVLRVAWSARMGSQQPDRLGKLRVRFGSLPVGSAVLRLAFRPGFAPGPVKAAGLWRAARLER